MIPLIVLNSMHKQAFWWQASSVCHPKGEVICVTLANGQHLLCTKRTARCTFSSSSMSYFNHGDQVDEAYSNWSLIRVWYICILICLGAFLIFWRIMPRVELALAVIPSMCLDLSQHKCFGHKWSRGPQTTFAAKIGPAGQILASCFDTFDLYICKM